MKNKKTLIKVGLKYCGGCKPNYDRVELVRQIQERLKDKAQFVAPDTDGVTLIAAVQGCPTACADLSAFDGRQIFLITSAQDAQTFIDRIEQEVRHDVNA